MISLNLLPPLLVPVVIFFSRIADVSLGTLRIIYVARSMKGVAAVLGFFEVLIWIIVVAQVMQNMTNWMNYVAYAAGFAAGNYIGIVIENKLKVGTLIYRVITKRDATELISYLRDNGYGATSLDADGAFGRVKIIFTVVRRRNWKFVQDAIETYVPKAFYSVEEIKHVSGQGDPASMIPRLSFVDTLLRYRRRF